MNEQELNTEWAQARANLTCCEMRNCYGKTPIELAEMNMEYKKALKDFNIIDQKVKDYVEDKCKSENYKG